MILFERNKAFLGVINDSTKVTVLDPKRAVAISDTRSLGDCKIHQGVLQQKLSKYYSFKSLQKVFAGYNNFRNKLQEETSKSGDPNPWLEPKDPGRKMRDRQITKKHNSINPITFV